MISKNIFEYRINTWNFNKNKLKKNNEIIILVLNPVFKIII